MIFLFFTRLALYLLAFSLPVFHPGVVISYDVTGWWLFYVLVPAEMALAAKVEGPHGIFLKALLKMLWQFLVH